MQNKSNIQLVREALDLKEMFRVSLGNILESYLVKDSVFAFDGKQTKEVIKGYFSIREEYSSLDEAFKNLNPNEQVRIINNEKFQVGTISRKLSEAATNKVYDIEFSNMVIDND